MQQVGQQAGQQVERGRRFVGKRVAVTGAAGGVGRSVVELLRAEGAQVVGMDLRVPKDAPAGVVAGDVTDEASVTAFAEHALTELGGLDVLCNVAGMLAFATLEEMTVDLLDRMHAVNVRGPMLMTRTFLPALTESRGNVVSVASISALMGQPYNSAYCSTKAGLLLMMRALAVELAGRGIRVNCVSPGGIDTDMPATAATGLPKDVDWNLIAKSQSVIPGFMPPVDVAEAVLFLASDAAASVTGSNVVVDRGVVW